MEEKSVGDQLEGALDGEDRGEEVVPVSQSLRQKHQFNVCLSFNTHDIDVRLTPERVFTGEQGGGDKNTDKDEVGHDGVTLQPVAEDPEEESSDSEFLESLS